jgi:hypothetical protein
MSTRDEGPGFLWDMACLKRYRQTRANGYTDQQFERDVRHTTIDDLAQCRLGQAEALCGYDLGSAHTVYVACKLQGDIAAQRLNGSSIC